MNNWLAATNAKLGRKGSERGVYTEGHCSVSVVDFVAEEGDFSRCVCYGSPTVSRTAATRRIVMFVVAKKMAPPNTSLAEMKIRIGFLPIRSATTPSTRLRIAEKRLIPMKVSPMRTAGTPILLS